ncbi:hypothetical protein ASE99_23825 [Serratia sp. Leaf51]|nr:hypothetical protein ASE99_23825 [Serratia sp. Leaf51]
MNRVLFFSITLIFMTQAFADKKPASELKWSKEDEKGCDGSICISDAQQGNWPNMLERTKKADRVRRVDPFSPYNSDSGDDQKNVGITFKFD